ncbi:MAG: tetratricopeptide repeat protein [Verrucomicrobia bacterium]|nr:tetratricopeptide repeat protein [Verrucomicrobiota bacterium]
MKSTPEYTEQTERDNHHQGSAREMTAASDRPELPHSIPPLPRIRCIPWFIPFKAVLLCMLWAVVSIHATAAESISVLLQKGIYAEETEGNLDAAIKIYEEIASESEANRALVAQAQYRLGRCQVKKGHGSAAAEAFRKILERFPDQSELVRLTHAQLAELGRPVSSTVVRQVWAPAMDTEGSVTGDGTLLSFVDWDTGDVAVRNLKTGENRRLTNKGSWNDSDEFAMYPIISRDGAQVAYCWYNKEELFDLRVVSVAKPTVRVVSKQSHVWCNPEDWSPDGKHFVAQIQDKETHFTRLALFSLEEDEERELKSFGFLAPSNVRFSPDGKFVAYGRRSNPEIPENDIYLLDVASGEETPLIQHPSNDKFMGWTQDGKALLFASDRSGSTDLWSASIANGRVDGEPTLLRPNLGEVYPIAILSDGRFFYGVSKGGSAFYRAKVDFDSGRTVKAPERIPLQSSGIATGTVVSPDGHKLLFASRQRNRSMMSVLNLETFQRNDLFGIWRYYWSNAPQWLGGDGRNGLFRGHRADGSKELVLFDTETGKTTPLSADVDGPEVSWNGGSAKEDQLLYVRWDSEKNAFFAVQRDLKTGAEVAKLMRNETDFSVSYAFDANAVGGTIGYSRTPNDPSDDNLATVERFEFETGKTESLLSLPYKFDRRTYPENPGRMVVLTTDKTGVPTVRLMELENGQGHERYSVQLPQGARVAWWGPQGRHLLYIKRPSSNKNNALTELWSVVTETGELRKTELAMPRILSATFHQKSDQLFVFAADPVLREVWVMENFLPTTVSTAK